MKRWQRIMRVTALSLLMVFAITAVLPLISSSAHSNRTAASSGTRKKLRRYSRAWWRRYRERQRRRRAALLRRKALAGLLQGKRVERQSVRDNSAASNPLLAPLSNMVLGNDSRTQSTPLIATEHGSRPLLSVAEKGVRLNTPDGQTVGQVAVSVVANAVNGGTAMAATPAARRRALSGVPFAALRRMVIDKMIASGGWVVNDFEREISGRRVYVVLAQTAAPNDRRVPQQSWIFYFTEAEGRIYNVVSTAPLEFSDRLALEAERVIAMLGPATTQQANPSASRR